MSTTIRSKENDCDFPLFKTPLRTAMFTPVRNRMLSSVTMNDIAFYSNHIKSLKFTGTTSMNDLQSCNDTIKTPIRLNKIKLSTPVSIQRRRALGLVNNNNPICHTLPNDDPALLASFKEVNSKPDEPVIAQVPSTNMTRSNSEDDLPQRSSHSYEDTFDDLIPTDERIERMLTNQTNGINLFAFHAGIENTIRYQSPHCSRIDVSSLLDMLN
ncbi:unnamed protein product [Rotaria socialis]|uniref:Uncharacterized protein n=1 Tax=Rotaria socialis TaxID=392032 RepID=A0A818IM59_9BILA|nr:unnamed protein product [Rotaria socialis]CAF3338344.1 unnamed protein product [Rotaria socialis]CAF3527422.1 unnamed protein product [Rotaria socialis]CAF3605371.1 unnamed protein product [Rotaria socialis]CAF4463115.1 unnamed protein product [Rotaria socialis]